jgi:hypothetical protein
METVVLGIGSFSSRRVVVDPRSVWSRVDEDPVPLKLVLLVLF